MPKNRSTTAASPLFFCERISFSPNGFSGHHRARELDASVARRANSRHFLLLPAGGERPGSRSQASRLPPGGPHISTLPQGLHLPPSCRRVRETCVSFTCSEINRGFPTGLNDHFRGILSEMWIALQSPVALHFCPPGFQSRN